MPPRKQSWQGANRFQRAPTALSWQKLPGLFTTIFGKALAFRTHPKMETRLGSPCLLFWLHEIMIFFLKALKVEMIWGKGRNIVNYDQTVNLSHRVGHWKKGYMLRQSLNSMLFFFKCNWPFQKGMRKKVSKSKTVKLFFGPTLMPPGARPKGWQQSSSPPFVPWWPNQPNRQIQSWALFPIAIHCCGAGVQGFVHGT